MGRIIAVCTSAKKGTRKTPVAEVKIEEGCGVAGDEVVLEMSQTGKECHTTCAIRKQVGDCIMPRDGIFARVIRGGTVRPGTAIRTYGDKTESSR